MPTYRNEYDDYHRKPKPIEKEKPVKEPEWEPEEDEEIKEDRKNCKKPCVCETTLPFKIEVKIIPCDDEHEYKRQPRPE